MFSLRRPRRNPEPVAEPVNESSCPAITSLIFGVRWQCQLERGHDGFHDYRDGANCAEWDDKDNVRNMFLTGPF